MKRAALSAAIDDQTDEAEIKAFMRAQRTREGESRAEMQTAKWTAEGTVNGRLLNGRFSTL